MTVEIFANYGVLGSKDRVHYTANGPCSSVYGRQEITVPDEIIYGENAWGELILELGGMRYVLQDVLANQDDNPVIRYYDPQIRRRKTIQVA